MQDYDESFFIAKANKRASITWFVLLLIASVFYGIKAVSYTHLTLPTNSRV